MPELSNGWLVSRFSRKFPWVLVALSMTVVACRQDMHDQPRYEPNSPSAFFANGTSVQPLVEGVVPRSAVLGDPVLQTGKLDGEPSSDNPLDVDLELLRRGRERYDIFCSPCHGNVGDGDGMIVQRGYRKPPSLHEERLRQVPDGYLYDVIANGYGVMPAYRAQVPVRDRWAMVAYVRALQLSQHAGVDALSPAERARVVKGGTE